MSGAGSEVGAVRAARAVRAVGAEGQGQQGRPGGDNGRGVKAVSGGGRKGGDSVKWVGKALRAAGAEGVWAHIGVRMRAVTGAV